MLSWLDSAQRWPGLSSPRWQLTSKKLGLGLRPICSVLPPLLWIGWTKFEAWRVEQARLRALREDQRVQVLNKLVEPWVPGDEVDLSHGTTP